MNSLNNMIDDLDWFRRCIYYNDKGKKKNITNKANKTNKEKKLFINKNEKCEKPIEENKRKICKL